MLYFPLAEITGVDTNSMAYRKIAKLNQTSRTVSTSKRQCSAMAPRTVAAAPMGEGTPFIPLLSVYRTDSHSRIRFRTAMDQPAAIGEALERVRQLQQTEQLTITTRRGIAKERELLLAQLEEHNYHLRYNLKMRDIVMDGLSAWNAKHDSGEHRYQPAYF